MSQDGYLDYFWSQWLDGDQLQRLKLIADLIAKVDFLNVLDALHAQPDTRSHVCSTLMNGYFGDLEQVLRKKLEATQNNAV